MFFKVQIFNVGGFGDITCGDRMFNVALLTSCIHGKWFV